MTSMPCGSAPRFIWSLWHACRTKNAPKYFNFKARDRTKTTTRNALKIKNLFTGTKEDSQSQNIARTAPKNFLNNSRGGYRVSNPNKTRALSQIAPENSAERSGKSLSHSCRMSSGRLRNAWPVTRRETYRSQGCRKCRMAWGGPRGYRGERSVPGKARNGCT